jgi:hypothetical protein
VSTVTTTITIGDGSCCCEEDCQGWYCCPLTGRVRHAANCAELDSFPICDEGSDSTSGSTHCTSCFPSPMPTSLFVNFTDLGVSFSIPNDAGFPYGFIGPVPEGVPEFGSSIVLFLSLCDRQADGDYHLGFAPLRPDTPDVGTGLLTLVSCNPIVLEGTFASVGHVIITE